MSGSTVSTFADLNSAIATADSLTSGSYTITINGDITETADSAAISLASGVSLVITGGTLDGGGQYEGLFVQQGDLTVQDLTIQNAAAQGGNGTHGGGGGAGLGGGLFIGSGGDVTLANAVFLNDSAIGGNGGIVISGVPDGDGNGGGLNGRGIGGAGTTTGTGSMGGFGGGGGFGVTGGGGGFGGGGGYSVSADGNPGFGGGSGGTNNTGDAIFGGGGGGGGGGFGGGGDIFVQQSGHLTIESGTLSLGTVAPGTNGASGTSAGAGFGTAIFLQGNQSQTLAPSAGQTLTITGAIDDQTGAIPSFTHSQGAGGLVINGAGTVILNGSGPRSDYTGGTRIDSGTLILSTAGAAGSGNISLAGPSTLVLDAAIDNTITGFAPGDVIGITSLAGATISNATDNHVTLSNGTHGITLNLLSYGFEALSASTDGQGGTRLQAAPSTMATAADFSSLNAAIAAADTLAAPGSYTIAITGTITETGILDSISLASGVSLVITGGTLDGGGQYEGLFVQQGAVTVQNLTIEDATAQGGKGTNGGGGGAGLGGGLYIAGTSGGRAGGQVTLANVNFFNDSALGGASQTETATSTGGFGGGLNGFGHRAGYTLQGVNVDGDPGSFGGGGGAGSQAVGGGNGGFGGGAGYGAARSNGNGGSTFAGSGGGFGGGNGGPNGGGGGLGAGGDIFVQEGGALIIESGTLGAGTVAGGTGGNPTNFGAGLGTAIFLQGNQTQTLAAGAGQTLSIKGAINDVSGSTLPAGDGHATGSAGLVINGAGSVDLTAASAYTGGTTIDCGTLILGTAGAAGSGNISFAGPGTLVLDADVQNSITGFTLGDVIGIAGLAGATISSATANNVTLSNGTNSFTLNLSSYGFEPLSTSTDGQGGTRLQAAPSTIATVADFSSLNAAIATADALTTPGSYTIAITGTITETGILDSISLAQGVSLVITGGTGGALDGGGQYEGFFVQQGDVTVQNLTLQDAAAIGGTGSNGGGSGAGLGGGLFIGSGGNVTLGNVNFQNDSATGGNFNTNPPRGNSEGGALNSREGGTGSFGVGGTNGGNSGFGGGGAGYFQYLNWVPSSQNGGQLGFGGGDTGGGLGAGGDIFVQQGGTLSIESGTLGLGTVTGGAGFSSSPGSSNGAAFGTAIFLQGNQSQILTPAAGQTLVIAGAIADETGSTVPAGDGTGTGSAGLIINGAGTVELTAASDYTGGTTIDSGGLILDAINAAGTGNIVFGSGDPPSLTFSTANAPTNTISGFTPGDVIDITDLSLTGSETLFADSNGVLAIPDSLASGGTLDLTFAGIPTTEAFVFSPDGHGGAAATALCYLRGTRILTPTGEKPIETLEIGDQVVTRFGGIQSIKWLGRQSYDPRFIANNPGKLPIRITQGALNGTLPHRDLYISPGHSMLLGDKLILASSLVNGITIRQEKTASQINYIQIELETHDCVQAEGAWSETFADAPGLRTQFHNQAKFWALYPDYLTPIELNLCAPRPQAGPDLEAALLPIEARASAGLTLGPLEGCIDTLTPNKITGWARDTAHPHLPVLLDIMLGDQNIATILACDPRNDLEEAGIGNCAFAIIFPEPLTEPELATLTIQRHGTALPIAANLRQAA